MAGLTLTIDASGVLSKLGRLSGAGLAEAGKALYGVGEATMTASKAACPVDTGTLRGTGHVDPPEQSGSGVSVGLGYGGPAAPYALYVHEGHRIVAWGRDTGRMQPPNKYLEEPMNSVGRPLMSSKLGADVGAGIKRAWG